MSLVNVDASQLKAFGTTLAGGATVRRALVSAAVKKGAQNVKESIEGDLKTSRNAAFRRIGIHYTMQTVGATGIAADISPTKGGPGSLANIAFFGTAKGGGTHSFYEHAEDELPALAEQVARVAGEVV
jgi:hypothetical protein